MLDFTLGRDEINFFHHVPQHCRDAWIHPINSQNAWSSVVVDPIFYPLLFWMSFPARRKSSVVGPVIYFHLDLLSMMMTMKVRKWKIVCVRHGVLVYWMS